MTWKHDNACMNVTIEQQSHHQRLPRLEHNENVKCVGSPTREFRFHDFFTIPLHMNECTILDVSELAMCHQVHLRASMSFESACVQHTRSITSRARYGPNHVIDLTRLCC